MIQKIKKMFRMNTIKHYRKKGASIGENCEFYNAFLDNGRPYLIEIGNNVTLTNCTILTHDASCKKYVKKVKVGKVIIGDNTFVGWGAIVLPNVKIGKNCIVGAGCVVCKDIPDNSIVVGNPCKIVGDTNSFKKKHEKNMKKYPVYNKYWKNKSNLEKLKEKKELNEEFGYDE